ncbi:MAG TPA: protein-disulfide reductase DsbD N-terminal domain-containing protein [Hyphomicrobiales bacterium]|nr:protein-disulfide reductase DsbD N-terminal domain-containing protein [Hyphomicrobiales bacterium]
MKTTSLLLCLPLLLTSSGLPAQSPLQTQPGGFGVPAEGSKSLVPGVLPAAQAFALSAFVEADTDIALLWEMPPAYYLYRKSLMLELADGSPLEDYILPNGVTVEDEFFGASEVYFDRLLLRLPLNAVPRSAFVTNPDGARTLELMVSYQGCAEEKYCYPPQHAPLTLELP